MVRMVHIFCGTDLGESSESVDFWAKYGEDCTLLKAINFENWKQLHSQARINFISSQLGKE